jgi:hypothetical protein
MPKDFYSKLAQYVKEQTEKPRTLYGVLSMKKLKKLLLILILSIITNGIVLYLFKEQIRYCLN